MPRLLLINPNTSESVTQTLDRAARQHLGAFSEVLSVTAPFGAPYITGEHSLAIAAHATITAREQVVTEGTTFDACLIGCFGDPALQALQELAQEPVIGLAEASMRIASRRGRFAIVTGGHGWREPLRRLAFSIGLLDALVAIETVDASGAQLAADPAWAQQLLAEACRKAITAPRPDGPQAESVIIGGAGLLGYAQSLSAHVQVPLLDSVLCGLEMAAERMGMPLTSFHSISPQPPTA